jgi:ABC-2 type transport system ATP-binding protein
VTLAQLSGVTKCFGSTRALDGATLAVEPGEVVALLGPNGAGKSTALAILTGLRRPTRGTARLFGADPRLPAARRSLGVTPQETAFPATLRVCELVELVRAHYAAPLEARVVYERFQLTKLFTRQLGGLSGGERRRVGVALAFAGDPRLVVLDEPTTSLDLEAKGAVWTAVQAHARRGGSVLLTTHQLEEADALADRVVLIEGGAVVADGAVEEVKSAAGMTVVRFRAVPGMEIDGAQADGAYVRILSREGGATVDRLLRAGVPLIDLEVRGLTLEEALAARRSRRAGDDPMRRDR